MRVALIDPDFPIHSKSRYHSSFLPIGLLKLASLHRSYGNSIKLVRGNFDLGRFYPDQILITSLFTYWSKYIWDCVKFYKDKYEKAEVIVGGIYASLLPDHCKKSGCDKVFVGVNKLAEEHVPAYDLVEVNYQIIHTTRGCVRKCKFCGTWKIEPKFTFKKSIKDEICSNKVIFYDNNLLANPYFENIMEELMNSRINGRPSAVQNNFPSLI
jgi:hypothetical protein